MLTVLHHSDTRRCEEVTRAGALARSDGHPSRPWKRRRPRMARPGRRALCSFSSTASRWTSRSTGRSPAPALATRYRVLALDLRGHGRGLPVAGCVPVGRLRRRRRGRAAHPRHRPGRPGRLLDRRHGRATAVAQAPRPRGGSRAELHRPQRHRLAPGAGARAGDAVGRGHRVLARPVHPPLAPTPSRAPCSTPASPPRSAAPRSPTCAAVPLATVLDAMRAACGFQLTPVDRRGRRADRRGHHPARPHRRTTAAAQAGRRRAGSRRRGDRR